jgi:hypothetical protein
MVFLLFLLAIGLPGCFVLGMRMGRAQERLLLQEEWKRVEAYNEQLQARVLYRGTK